MSKLFYHLIEGTAVENVVVFVEGRLSPYLADSSHPNWERILDGLRAGDDSVIDLFDIGQDITNQMARISDRVSYDGNNILFDGQPQSGPLAEHLERAIKQGTSEYAPIVKFWEKVAKNPDARSREQLFTWLASHQFTISVEGDIVGYKSVDLGERGIYMSWNSGTAYVDGVKHTGKIPNEIGSVITMPRDQVVNDPYASCHRGLHVGDWSFAKGFNSGHILLEVHVSPEHVVSIPFDSSARKMRCCEYKVVQRIGKHYDGSAIRIGTNDNAYTGDVGYVVPV